MNGQVEGELAEKEGGQILLCVSRGERESSKKKKEKG